MRDSVPKARFLAAAVVGMVVIAAVGGLLYGVVFAGFIKANLEPVNGVMKAPEFLWVGLAHVPFGLLLALLVLWRGELSARGGEKRVRWGSRNEA